MRLIIDISEDTYERIKALLGTEFLKDNYEYVMNCVANGTPVPRKIISPMTACKFGDLKKGDRFCYEGDKMIKTCRIKAGNDGAFYTAVSIVTGNHYCIADDLEVYV